MTQSSPQPARIITEAPALRKNSIGIPGMVFMVVAATAPLTAMASNFALSLSFGSGAGTLGWIVFVAALFAVFTAGYVVLSRHVVNAGAYYAFIGFGLGRTTGAASAFIATIAYNLAAATMVAAAGYFTDITMAVYLGVDLEWYLYSLIALGAVWALGHFGVGLAARITTAVSITQFVLLGLLAAAVLFQRPEGFTVTGFTPESMFSGNYALAMVFCVLSFASFEATAIYGEECKAPRSSIKKATYLALGLLVSVYLVATWAMVAAYDDVMAAGQEDPGTLVIRAANEYLGAWSGILISICVAFSFLAAAVAFHNMAARYHFSLGRSGLLPKKLSLVHPKYGTPHAASFIQVAVCAVVLAPFAIAKMDPLINLFPAVSGVTSLALIFLMTSCSISVVAAFKRGKVAGSLYATVIAPTIAAIGLATVGAIIVFNYQELTGSDSVVVAFMPLILVIGAAYGAIKYRSNAHIVLEEHLSE